MGRPKGSKNKPKNEPSSAPSKVTAKAAPEPETFTCKGSETVLTERKPLLGKCIECEVFDSHSEVDHLCLSCHKAKEGFVFDDETKRYIKPKRRKV